MNIDEFLHHFAFAIGNGRHIDAVAGNVDAELCSACPVGSYLGGVDDVFARETGNVWAGATHPFALNHGNALTLTCERPSEELGAFAAANDDEIVLFGRESGVVRGEFCHKSLQELSESIMNAFFILEVTQSIGKLFQSIEARSIWISYPHSCHVSPCRRGSSSQGIFAERHQTMRPKRQGIFMSYVAAYSAF